MINYQPSNLTINGQSPWVAVTPLTIRAGKLSVLVQCVSDVSMTSVNVSNSLSTVLFVVVDKVVVVVVVALPAQENPVWSTGVRFLYQPHSRLFERGHLQLIRVPCLLRNLKMEIPFYSKWKNNTLIET